MARWQRGKRTRTVELERKNSWQRAGGKLFAYLI